MEINLKNLISVIFVFGLGMIIFTVMGDVVRLHTETQKSNLKGNARTNESVLLLGNTSVLSCKFIAVNSPIVLANGTTENWVAVSSPNISFDESGGILLYGNFAGNDSLVSYTCIDRDYYYNMSIKGQQGQFKLARFMPLTGLVVGALVIIGVLFGFLVFTKKE